MKPYGIPRNLDVQWPDAMDLRTYAMKASRGMIKNKSGQRRSQFKNAEAKAATRRYFKKQARRHGTIQIDEQLTDNAS